MKSCNYPNCQNPGTATSAFEGESTHYHLCKEHLEIAKLYGLQISDAADINDLGSVAIQIEYFRTLNINKQIQQILESE